MKNLYKKRVIKPLDTIKRNARRKKLLGTKTEKRDDKAGYERKVGMLCRRRWAGVHTSITVKDPSVGRWKGNDMQ